MPASSAEQPAHPEEREEGMAADSADLPEEVPVPALKGPQAWNSFKSMSKLLVEDSDEELEEERVEELIQELGALEEEEEEMIKEHGKHEREEMKNLMAEFGHEVDHEEMAEFLKGFARDNKGKKSEDGVPEEGLDPRALPPKSPDSRRLNVSFLDEGEEEEEEEKPDQDRGGKQTVSFTVQDPEKDAQNWAPGASRGRRNLASPPKGPTEPGEVPTIKKTLKQQKPIKICMMVVGTYGDVLPFLAVGDILKREGHTVRVATHEVFRQKVVDRGLDFFCLGADPLLLSEFMVKHKSLLISNPLKAIPALSDLGTQLKLAKEIIDRSWPAACSNKFRADAIIANPPAWGHVHVAEKLNVPLHIMFPQPWLPTKQFPHVFSGWDFGLPPREKNVFSHKLMDAMMYMPIHFAVNRFRRKLGLNHVTLAEGMGGLLNKRHIPFSFIWSEALVPFPSDWPPERADITGAIHNPPEDYEPDKKLETFLADGPPPILITFGSMRIQNGANLARRIRWAAKKAQVRVLVQSGWTDLAVGMKPDSLIHHIKAAPHTWLLPRMAAAVHHGGAGTTHAAALAGKPQQVCPFFGDQPFWGFAIHKAGAALKPVPIDDMSQERLAAAFSKLVKSKELKAKAETLARKLAREDGAAKAALSFWKHYRAFQPALRSRRSSVVQQKRMPMRSSTELQRLRRSTGKRGSMSSMMSSFGPFGERVDILRPSVKQLPQFRAPEGRSLSPQGRVPSRTSSPWTRTPRDASAQLLDRDPRASSRERPKPDDSPPPRPRPASNTKEAPPPPKKAASAGGGREARGRGRERERALQPEKKGDELKANKGDDLKANKGDDLKANKGDDLTANKGDDLTANKGGELKANKGGELKANKGGEIKANKGGEIKANKGGEVKANKGGDAPEPPSKALRPLEVVAASRPTADEREESPGARREAPLKAKRASAGKSVMPTKDRLVAVDAKPRPRQGASAIEKSVLEAKKASGKRDYVKLPDIRKGMNKP